MRKLSLLLTVSFTVSYAFSQGTVTFLNDTVALTSPPDRFIRWGYSNPALGETNGAPAFGTNLMVQLYYGVSGSAASSLIPLSAAPATLRVSTTTVPGTWRAGGTRTFQSAAPGAQLTLQVRVWDISFGATYEAAIANGGLAGHNGVSALFGYVVPQASDPPVLFTISNFMGFILDVPEPSSCILILFGAGLLAIAAEKQRLRRSVASK